jgi:hypothetical protein
MWSSCLDIAGFCSSFRQADSKSSMPLAELDLEHMHSPTVLMPRSAWTSPPGGIFIVFTPYREVHTTTPENPYHLREYSPETLRSLLQPHFSTVCFFGRRPAPALRRVEDTLDKVRRYDPLRLRTLVPRSVRHRLGNLWLLKSGAKLLDQVSVNDVEYVDDAPPGSTNLIAVCRLSG